MEWINYLKILMKVSFYRMEHSQKEDAGLAWFESVVKALGNEVVAALQ
jgi:hypothetical protein